MVRIAPESEIIISFYLRPADGGGLPLSKPGQYITVRVPDARGQTTMRNYSLSNAPGEDHFRISVKQEPKGFVSAFLHESSKVIVDSTVKENNVSYPLDTKQYRKIILRCWKLADKNGVGLRRRYRKEVRACIMAQRLRKDPRRRKAARRGQRRLRTIVGALMRELERKLPAAIAEEQRENFTLYRRVLAQKPQDTDKIYSLHEPHIYCVAKGKEHPFAEVPCGSGEHRVHAFRELVRQLADLATNLKVHYRYSEASEEDRTMHWHDSEGFIDAELLEDMLAERDADYYFCGPKPFMVGIYNNLLKWGIPASQVHFEFFGPRQELEGAEAQPA